MHDSRNASILRCSDSAVEQDTATEHISFTRERVLTIAHGRGYRRHRQVLGPRLRRRRR